MKIFTKRTNEHVIFGDFPFPAWLIYELRSKIAETYKQEEVISLPQIAVASSSYSLVLPPVLQLLDL